MKTTSCLFAILWVMIMGLTSCDKTEHNTIDLTGTTWVCDTAYSGIDYYYRITFTSKDGFDYYEDGFVELNEKGTYSYKPPKIDLTIWGITVEGSIEGDKLYYPTLATDDVDAIMRIFTKQ